MPLGSYAQVFVVEEGEEEEEVQVWSFTTI
jgi:hypothetical protein